MALKNWGGNLDYGISEIQEPKSIDELASIITQGKMRPIGTRHSFSKLAMPNERLVSATAIPANPVLDETARTVTVGAGTRFGELAIYLEEHGWALANMGSLPHISIAGAAATGTHGSGDGNPILSTSVRRFEYLNAGGELVSVSRGEPDFEICRLGLGAYGIWVRVTLDIQPTYFVRQDVYKDVPWNAVLDDLDSVMGAGYSVSMFSDWMGSRVEQVWVKSRMDGSQPPAKLHGVAPDPVSYESFDGSGEANLTSQGGQPGPWLLRLPHFRLDATPSAGEEIQTEYFVLRKDAPAAMREIRKIAAEIKPALIWSEIRSIAKDDAWLSPMNRGDSIALHFTWKLLPAEVDIAISKVESVISQFDAIPHWGKLNSVSVRNLQRLFPKLDEARSRFEALDPEQRFTSKYLQSRGVRI
ncbi:MAG: FAD-binding protein [Micrococcales bacterium]